MARILTLSNMYPPHSLGGYEASCRDVMERFVARGHDVTVLTTDMRVTGVDDPPDEPARGVRRLLRFYWDDHVLLHPPFRARLDMERHNHAVLAETLRAARPDVVSVWNMGAMSLSLLTALEGAGLPLVLAVCDDWLVYGPRLDPWTAGFARVPRMAGAVVERALRVPIRRPSLEQAVFLFVSDATRERARRAGAWPIGTSTVVHSGIEARDFPVDDTEQARPWHGRILYVGRLDPRKGIETLLRATALVEGIELAVVGHGDDAYRHELAALCAAVGITDRVSFRSVPRAEIAREYRAADALVFPSEWTEPFGLVPIEAMACSTPVIATRVGGSAEFLEADVNCITFPPKDVDALAAAIVRLRDDDDLRARLVRRGHELAGRMTTDRLADVMEEWHLRAIRERRVAP